MSKSKGGAYAPDPFNEPPKPKQPDPFDKPEPQQGDQPDPFNEPEPGQPDPFDEPEPHGHSRKLGKRLASSQPSRDVENAPGRPPAAPSGRIAPSVEHARQAIGGQDALGLQGVNRRR